MKAILCTLLVIFSFAAAGQSSVLSNGTWYKFSVEKEGVYKITYDALRKTGIDISKTDPRKIRIFGNEGGMLPQSNSTPRPYDLEERSIFISGENDGKFDKSDFILLYANGPYKASFDIQRNVFEYQNNLYSDKNFYFLTVSDQDGKRVTDVGNLDATANLISSFNDYVYHELDDHNELHSGREWYGEKFSLNNTQSFSFNISGIVPGSALKIVSDVMGQSYANAAFRIFVNDVKVGEQAILPIASERYAVKGFDRRDTISFSDNSVGASQTNDLEVGYEFANATGFSQGYLDFFLLNFERELNLYGKQTIFTSAASVSNSVSTFHVGNANANSIIWDVTNPSEIKSHTFDVESDLATFTTETSSLKKFVVFTSDVEAPRYEGSVPNQDLHGLTTPNLLIITNPLFESEAERLANHRRSASGWTTEVVTTEQVYNEFSSGRQDVTAIRDLVRHLYNQNPGALKAVLLFGRGSYDYKDRVNDNTNFVATYESRNSLNPLRTYSSDDYFGFLEETEGDWSESPVKNHTLDVGIGRLPVKSLAQAKAVVDKIIKYDSDRRSMGYWRKKIVFVADDGNGDDGFTSLHQSQSNELAQSIEEFQPYFDTKKIFMGVYPKVPRASGEGAPRMTDDIVRAFEDGSLIINYTGHGSEQIWADEAVFSGRIIQELRNKTYPFLVTATCEFGRNDDPFQTSSAEASLMLAGAGSIGLVATARPVNATTNFELNQAFYEALFQRTASGYPHLAEVFRNTKNNSMSGVANRNFSLLGDPSMTLALPPDFVKINSIKTAFGSDTLKALSTVTVTGEIQNFGGEKLIDFDGTLEAALYDKQIDYRTIGRNNPAFVFKEWSNVLFRGRAAVTNGEFSFQFILPKNMAYSIAQGRLSLYAANENGSDANGYYDNFKIGGTEKSYAADSESPEIRVFMGDSTFQDGGITQPDSYIVAKLADESGINISGYGIGNSIVATLDDGAETWSLNNYYVADENDFTKGTIIYPVYGLTPGRHTLTLEAWDVYNNSSQATIDFVVTGEGIVIEELGNYPNPFSEKTTLFFTHNRSGDDLEAHLFIYNSTGTLIEALEVPITESEYRIDLLEFEAQRDDKKLPAGLYFARLLVRSLSNGSKNEQVTKLIILN